MARRILAVALLAILAAPSCSFFRQPSPDDSCNLDEDCFRGAGEVCNQETNKCVIASDAAPPSDAPPPPPDAGPQPDADPSPDAGPLIDGGAVDAAGVDA